MLAVMLHMATNLKFYMSDYLILKHIVDYMIKTGLQMVGKAMVIKSPESQQKVNWNFFLDSIYPVELVTSLREE
jgi:hypothetical protein